MKNENIILYALVLVACVTLVFLSISQDYGRSRTIHEMLLLDYPEEVNSNESITFSIIISNNALYEQAYTMKVFLDDTEKETRRIQLLGKAQTTEEFTIQNGLDKERYRVTVTLYDDSASSVNYGSPEYPYYVFFNVDVI